MRRVCTASNSRMRSCWKKAGIAGTARVAVITQRSPPGNFRFAAVTHAFPPIAQGCPDTLLNWRDRIVSKII
jgi:hypothetical protein